ncbi:S8 family serine peptidase [Ideonella livida]|uniref:S8 family serine peptidase n=1 Tax=Ideonella livida TaxID=2707176 RepID=A0A7C9TMP0_9BURK|nr:S8 family serine peptidase [Ideonella livida]NDY92527.1 S8 family serine peptidase [Ideonella livida]
MRGGQQIKNRGRGPRPLGAARTVVGLGLAAAAAAAAWAPASLAAGEDVQRVIVVFKPQVGAAARTALPLQGGQVRLSLPEDNAVAVELPAGAVEALRRHPSVAQVHEDVRRYPMGLADPSKPPYRRGQLVPYGIPMVQADQLPVGDAQTGNRKLCIIDSGYDRSHEDLATNKVDGEYDSGTGWWHTDETHHGTHVAGTIAAINQAGVGVVGVNPGRRLQLHIVKVFGEGGDWTYSSSLTKAARKCQAAGANIISMSLGGATPTPFERDAFARLAADGILSIAAAGNAGTSATSYPAGYPSVMSVAAVDIQRKRASFSQFNPDVEIAAPGVAVLSTVPMGQGREATLSVAATAYAPQPFDGTPVASASGPLADFGEGTAVDPAMAGKVCLIRRGTISFAQKVVNCQQSGGVAAVVYNNEAGGLAGTLGGVTTTIASVGVSDTEGQALRAQLGQGATVQVSATDYAYFDGTSMATPHVSGVAALVWSYFPQCSAAQIRTTLQKSALDLGPAGRDKWYGFGLVQAKAAHDRLASLGCAN